MTKNNDQLRELEKQHDGIIGFMVNKIDGQPTKKPSYPVDRKYEGWLYENILKDLRKEIAKSFAAEKLREIRRSFGADWDMSNDAHKLIDQHIKGLE